MSKAETPPKPEGDVVGDAAKAQFSNLWKTEDYWAIWLGVLVLLFGSVIYLGSPPKEMEKTIAAANATMAKEAATAPFETIAWYKAAASKHRLKANSQGFGKYLKDVTSKPKRWKSNPAESLFLSEQQAAQKRRAATATHEQAKAAQAAALATAQSKEGLAAAADYKDDSLNQDASAAILAWVSAKKETAKAKKKATTKPYNRIGHMIALGIAFAFVFGIGIRVMGQSFIAFAKGFAVVFALALLAYFISAHVTAKTYGIGYAAWAIAIGLLISNTIGTPAWVKPAVQTEYFIKTGLVLLGAEILFGKILSIGVPGVFVAWVVTPIVLVTTFIFGQKIVKIPSKTLNITISADMSVCGVSAAIATASACRAKKEELTLAVGLSLVFTSIMMVVMPAFIKTMGIPEILGGAWMGGTIDATGAVAAAGAFLGEKALYTAATIKMIQNVLIGVIAFCVAIYWCAKVERAAGNRVGLFEIWHRFPKFVIGFVGASIVFSTLYASLGPDVGYTLIDQGVIRGLSKNLRGWFFCLAFVSIGLATNFRELRNYFKGGKPLLLYVCGQSFNLLLTLLMAYLMFYVVFPEITSKI